MIPVVQRKQKRFKVFKNILGLGIFVYSAGS